MQNKATGDLSTLGTAVKPSVPNVTFKATIEAVKQGRVHCGYALIETFSLDTAQMGLLIHSIQQCKSNQ